MKTFMAEGRRYRVGEVIVVPGNSLGEEWVVTGPVSGVLSGRKNVVGAHLKGRPGVPNVFFRRHIQP